MLLGLERRGFGKLVIKNSRQMGPRTADIFMKPLPWSLPLEHFAFKVGNVSRVEYALRFKQMSSYSKNDLGLLEAFHPDYEELMNTVYGKQLDVDCRAQELHVEHQEILSVSSTSSHEANYPNITCDRHLATIDDIKKEPLGE